MWLNRYKGVRANFRNAKSTDGSLFPFVRESSDSDIVRKIYVYVLQLMLGKSRSS